MVFWLRNSEGKVYPFGSAFFVRHMGELVEQKLNKDDFPILNSLFKEGLALYPDILVDEIQSAKKTYFKSKKAQDMFVPIIIALEEVYKSGKGNYDFLTIVDPDQCSCRLGTITEMKLEDAMQFTLIAKNMDMPVRHYKITYLGMGCLQSAMCEAGVSAALVYGKFSDRNGQKVTMLQSKTISNKLKNWLTGKSLYYFYKEWKEVADNDVLGRISGLLNAVQPYSENDIIISQKVNKPFRKTIETFADFCENSGGFKVK